MATRKDFAEFCELLEEALDAIELPPGIVKERNIADGSVGPRKCDLKQKWIFKGPVVQLADLVIEEPEVGAPDNVQGRLAAINISDREKTGDDEVYFLDAVTRTAILTLPPAAVSFGRRVHVKRIDSNTSGICRIETTGDDKIDLVDRLSVEAREGFVLIASKTTWHILSSYSP